MPPQPNTPCAAALWRYDALRPLLMRAGELISAAEAVRRVLVLENPGLPGLVGDHAIALRRPAADPARRGRARHRHTQSALRFVVEGSGAYTAVDGERTTMQPGDFIITPAWTWHDHGSDAGRPGGVARRARHPDGALLRRRLRRERSTDSQPITRPEGHSLARYGANMAPVREAAPHGATSPIFSYPYAR